MNDRQPPAGLSGASASPVSPPLWLLALITFSGTLAMHIFVPVLPIAAKALNATPSAMQLTISFYIFGLAVGQLFYGPLSDRYGRRPILMIGLAVYMVASLAALFAPTVDMLIVARLFQALGGCAGLVISRAIVRDTSATAESTRRLALVNVMVAIGPGLAPIVGSALGEFAGWRSIFVALSLLGLANLLFTWKLLAETSRKVAGQSATLIVRNYGKLMRTPAFLGYAVGGGCATTSFYAFISAAPFIFIDQLHRQTHEIGFYIALVVLGFWFGSVITSRAAGKMPIRKLLVISNLVSLAAAASLFAAAGTGNLSVSLVIGLMFVFTVGAGAASPAALAEAISVNPLVIGSASGLYGFIQMGVGAICTALAAIGTDHALTAATIITLACILSQICFWIANRASRRAG